MGSKEGGKNANAFNRIDLHYFTVRVRVGSSLDFLSSFFRFSLFFFLVPEADTGGLYVSIYINTLARS